MKNQLISGVSILVTSLLLGCQGADERAIPVADVSISQSDQVLEDLALMVTQSLGSPNFRGLVKQEAMKQFDGDYDILLKEFVDQTDIAGHSVRQILIENETLTNTNSSAKARFKSLLSDALAKNPLLNISVPMHIEAWDAATFIPLVVVNAKESKSSKLKAYKSDGTIVWLDKDVAPTEPVIVIGWNERVEIKGNSFEVKKFTSPSEATLGKGAGARIQEGVCRNFGSTEYLSSYRYDVSAIESFFDGKPEINIRYYSAPGNLVSYLLFAPDRGQSGSWINEYYRLFTWQPSSPNMLYVVYESDGGSGQITRTFNQQGFNFDITTGSNDVFSFQYVNIDNCTAPAGGIQEYNFSWMQQRMLVVN